MFKNGTDFSSQAEYRRALFRLPLDDLMDVLYYGSLKEQEVPNKQELSSKEYAYIVKSVVLWEDLLRDQGDDKPSYTTRNKKWPVEGQFYDNFYRRVFVDVILQRKYATSQ